MEHSISSDLIRGHIDTIILHTLLDGDKFAQQIIDFVDKKSDKNYQINQATLYSSLKRLENLKYVRSYWNDFNTGRRKYFSITETGKNVVSQNLSNWSYSRSIIDKLMDIEPEHNVVYVEKIVEKPVQMFNNSDAKTEATTTPSTSSIKLEQYFDKALQNPENFEKKTDLSNEEIKLSDSNIKESSASSEDIKEINFRSIINGLIKTTNSNKNIQQKQEIISKENIENNDNSNEDLSQKSFNESITTSNFEIQKFNTGKIDFGDLTLKAAKEGFKISISSKDSAKNNGGLYINKLNFISSLILFLLLAVEIFIFCSTSKNSLFSAVNLILFSLLLVYLIYFVVKFIKNKNKTISKRSFIDEIITVSVVAFNVIIIDIAANVFLSTDFYNVQLLVNRFIFPIVICLNFVLFSIFKMLFSKCNFFYVKKID